MARVDDGGFGQGVEFFANAGEEEVRIASGEVPTTDATAEEDISPEELSGIAVEKAEAARAVTRDMKKIEIRTEKILGGTFIEEELGVEGLDFQGKSVALEGVGVGDEGE